LGFGAYVTLLSLLVPLALLMYSAIILTVPVLRAKLPQHNRPYKAPFGRTLPYVIVALYLGTIITWLVLQPGAMHLFKIAISFIIIGIPIYLLLLFHYEPDIIIRFNNKLAYLNLWMENILLPKNVRKDITHLFKSVRSKVVLEFGTGVGTLTMHLAEEVGPKGKIYATELSERNVAILKERLRKKSIKHVQVIFDEHQVNRVHPDVKRVEIIFSVGMLSYLQDAKKVLSELNRLLPKNGEICFVEYVDFFWVLPNVGWLSSEEKIKQMFKSAGFAVHVKKRRGLLWNYLFVYGIKTDEEVPYI
jgi:SAM-dependent methyltransferase